MARSRAVPGAIALATIRILSRPENLAPVVRSTIVKVTCPPTTVLRGATDLLIAASPMGPTGAVRQSGRFAVAYATRTSWSNSTLQLIDFETGSWSAFAMISAKHMAWQRSGSVPT